KKKLTALYIYQPTQERAHLKLARAWRKITTTPGLSDKAARPVSVRARHTGSGWQPAAGGQEWPG
ncbi:hypothetical protein DQZ64_16630, partial [Salmonella enterica subsp. enterica serovar Bareilly]|nr:hypothetical protein [Salmonella enterica subsp. enterica serovar Bareilly]